MLYATIKQTNANLILSRQVRASNIKEQKSKKKLKWVLSYFLWLGDKYDINRNT